MTLTVDLDAAQLAKPVRVVAAAHAAPYDRGTVIAYTIVLIVMAISSIASPTIRREGPGAQRHTVCIASLVY